MRVAGILLTAAIGCISSSASSAYEVRTHEMMSEKAATFTEVGDGVLLDSLLRSRYGLLGGLDTDLVASDGSARKAVAWISEGANREDATFDRGNIALRFDNHFHDPTCEWSHAGLAHGFTGSSAILWAQNPAQSAPVFPRPVTPRSWWDARKWLLEAATSEMSDDRDSAWAELFLTLGSQVHLVQDMASPAHTRNDPHPPWNRDFMHVWANDHNDDVVAAISESQARPFVDGVLTTLPSAAPELAPVPIANLFDVTNADGNGARPDASGHLGLAEYSTRFFVSDDTMHLAGADEGSGCGHYEGPSWNEAYACERSLPGPVGLRAYVCSGASGSEIVLGTQSALVPDHAAVSRAPGGSDDVVAESYAAHLLPRAIGYSEALLAYFFRASFDVVREESLEAPAEHWIVNLGAEDVDGVFELFYDDGDGQRRRLATVPTNGPLAPDGSLPLTFTAPLDARTPGEYFLVFHGRMGMEGAADSASQFAVAAAQVTICPWYTPHDGLMPELADSCWAKAGGSLGCPGDPYYIADPTNFRYDGPYCVSTLPNQPVVLGVSPVNIVLFTGYDTCGTTGTCDFIRVGENTCRTVSYSVDFTVLSTYPGETGFFINMSPDGGRSAVTRRIEGRRAGDRGTLTVSADVPASSAGVNIGLGGDTFASGSVQLCNPRLFVR